MKRMILLNVLLATALSSVLANRPQPSAQLSPRKLVLVEASHITADEPYSETVSETMEHHKVKAQPQTVQHNKLHLAAEDPTVQHQKVKGNGYEKGSPLYDEEQKAKQKEEESQATPVSNKDVEKALEDPAQAAEKWWWKAIWANVFMALGQAVCGIVVTLLFAYCYRRQKEDPAFPPRDSEEHSLALLSNGEFRYGAFGCFEDGRQCLLGCCCPSIRWADTMRMAGFMAFWPAAILATCLLAFAAMSAGVTVTIFSCAGIFYRQQIRELFGAEKGSHFFMDCLMWCCCSCCAIVQEARQLEEAYALDHPVVKVSPYAGIRGQRLQ